VGHVATLSNSPPWKSLVDHVCGRGCLFPALPPYAHLLTATRKQLLAGASQGSEPSRLEAFVGGSKGDGARGEASALPSQAQVAMHGHGCLTGTTHFCSSPHTVKQLITNVHHRSIIPATSAQHNMWLLQMILVRIPAAALETVPFQFL